MQTQNISYTKVLKTGLVKFVSGIVVMLAISKSPSAKAEIEDVSFGVITNTMLTNTIGLFYEYKVIPFLGLSIGVEYGDDFFVCLPISTELKDLNITVQDKIINSLKRVQTENKQVKNLTQSAKNEILKVVESDWGYYKVDFISIPLCVRLHPFAGDLCLFLGARLDFLLSTKGLCILNMDMDDRDELEKQFHELDAVKKPWDAKEKLLGLTKNIKNEEKKLDSATNLLNSSRWSLLVGMDHTFFFGLRIGAQFRAGITSFINYNNTKSQVLLDWTMQGSLGIDIVKIINLVS